MGAGSGCHPQRQVQFHRCLDGLKESGIACLNAWQLRLDPQCEGSCHGIPETVGVGPRM